jgi:hypothetical protein
LAWRLAEVFEADDWRFRQLQELCGLKAAVTRDNPIVFVNQYRCIEAEGFDAFRDGADLGPIMGSRIAWIRNEVCDQQKRQLGVIRRTVLRLYRGICRPAHCRFPARAASAADDLLRTMRL